MVAAIGSNLAIVSIPGGDVLKEIEGEARINSLELSGDGP